MRKFDFFIHQPIFRECRRELPEVYRRVKHFKGEPYDVEIANPAYPAELRERCVRLF